MLPIRPLLALLLLALPASLAAQQADSGAVTLRFGWKAGDRARVAYEQVRERRAGGRVDTVRGGVGYVLLAEPHPRGMLVRTDSLDWTRVPAIVPGGGAYMEQLAGTLFFPPRYVIDAEGRFGGAEGVPQTRLMVSALAMRVVARNMRGAPAQGFQILEQLVTEPLLEGVARADWNNLVELWIGHELDPAAPWTFESVGQSPAAPGAPIPVRASVAFLGRVPCDEGAATAACVRWEMTTRADPAAIRQALRGVAVRAGLPAATADALVREAAMEDVLTFVSEPGTLRPHRLATRRTMTILDASGARPVPATVTDQRTWRFAWRG